jgi:hypothetical protein
MVYISPDTGEEKIPQCTFVPVDRGNGQLFILGNLQDISSEKQLQKKLMEEAEKSREEMDKLKSVIQDMQRNNSSG